VPEEIHFPRPISTLDDQEFWNGCNNDELRLQKCSSCSKYRWLPKPMCPQCNSLEHEWVKVSGKGRVYSWTIVVHPVHPAANRKVPYNVAQVQLEEDPEVILVTNLVGVGNDDITMGMPVEVVFEEDEPGVKLPKFRPI